MTGRNLVVRMMPSSLKKRYYKWRGAKIGKGVSFGLFSIIEADSIEIGDFSQVGMFVRIKARKFKMGAYSKIGKDTMIASALVKIGNETTIQDQVIIGGMQTRSSRIEIGDRCIIFRHSFLNPTKPIKIGNEVGIGGANYLFTHGSWSNMLEGFPVTFGPITIEDRVWLPWRVFVLPNVTIGHDSIVAAGSVVSKSIPPFSLAAGVPAEVKRSGEEFIKEQSREDKIQTLKLIFQDFDDYLAMNRYSASGVRNSASDKGIIWESAIERKDGSHLGFLTARVSLSNNEMGATKLRFYCISIDPIPDEVKKQIESTGGAWFQISDYSWKGQRNQGSSDIRSFLSRFGVRFKSMDLLDES
jgi:acetyltransferase-like isoleucine patch superfamily enzyme